MVVAKPVSSLDMTAVVSIFQTGNQPEKLHRLKTDIMHCIKFF
jgi:hypothetical protein